MLFEMTGRFGAVALVAGGLAAAAVVGAFACGGDTFRLASGEGGTPVRDRETGQDSAVDAGELDAAATDAPETLPATDAIALPDVLDEAPPHCAGAFECVPPIPAGWQGPFEIFRGKNPPSTCSANFFPSYQGNDGIDAGPATCGCSCGLATGVQCADVVASFFVSTLGVTSCASVGHCKDVPLPSQSCIAGIDVAKTQCPGLLGSTGLNTNMQASLPGADGGSCEPIPTTTLPPVQWDRSTLACISMVASAQVDCPAGTLCAPSPSTPFDSTFCIAQAGDVVCPATGYPNKSISFSGTIDGRRCTGCACGPVTGSSCTGYVDVTPTPSSPTGTSCGSNYTRYQLPASCDPVQQPGDFRATVTPQPGSCTPTQPTPSGNTFPAGATTFCCR
jgi:hypothetical protein